MARKTINVDTLKQFVNEHLKSEHISQDQKMGMCVVLELALMESGKYTGYNYLHWLDSGYTDWVKAGKPMNNNQFIGPEYSRVYY